MQPHDWNDLRYVLAICRARSLAGAAKRLKVDATTVSRRLAALEKSVGARLLQRAPDGRWTLTERGQAVIGHFERIEREMGDAREVLSGKADDVAGTVRLTSVPLIVNHILVPALPDLLRAYPLLEIELIAETQNLSLTRREADIALRLARPQSGGRMIVARRAGTLVYEAYAPASCSLKERAKLPWITYEEGFAHLPQARWIGQHIARSQEVKAPMAVSDATTIIEAIAAGLGKSLLPRIIGDNDPRLRRLGGAASSEIARELWLLTHRDIRDYPRIRAVNEWIARMLAKTRKTSAR